MKTNVKRGLLCIWALGALGWAAANSGLGGSSWLRGIIGLPLLPLPDQSSPPGMPTLPGNTLLVLLRDAILPPLLLLLVGVLIGWIIGALWKRHA